VGDIANRAASYDIPGIVVDGLDFFSVYEAAGAAIDRARKGLGPTLIEAKTYRFYGHFQGDTITYRTDDEVSKYRDRDPIRGLRTYLVDHEIATAAELDAIDQTVTDALDQSWTEAKAAPWPAAEDALTNVYVSY
jgi:pyruvate dehydrogenase E1 component alpha subunit